MNKNYSGDWPATIISYDAKGRTAKISIPTVTDGIESGITATFAYPVGDDDKDTEREILAGAECYIFFLQCRPDSPVIWAFRSHGTGAVVDTRRIRQENIELLARANILLKAEDVIDLDAKLVRIRADRFEVISPESEFQGNNTVTGKSDLVGGATIEGVDFDEHGHKFVKSGTENSGGVVGL